MPTPTDRPGRRAARPIELLVVDVDGVLTDGVIAIDDRGVETKHFHVRDGSGVRPLAEGRASGRRSSRAGGPRWSTAARPSWGSRR